MDISQFLQKNFGEKQSESQEQKQNLCDTFVQRPEKHLLCAGNLGILRKDMPQFQSSIEPDSIADRLKQMGVLKPNPYGGVDVSFLFLKLLKNLGKEPEKPQLVFAGSIKPTQSEIVASNVSRLMQKLKANPNWQKDLIEQCYGKRVSSPTSYITNPLLVSDDLYLVDGHHSLSAMIASSNPSGSGLICIRKIPLSIQSILTLANKFTEEMGLERQKGV